jgi:hypothetical protein
LEANISKNTPCHMPVQKHLAPGLLAPSRTATDIGKRNTPSQPIPDTFAPMTVASAPWVVVKAGREGGGTTGTAISRNAGIERSRGCHRGLCSVGEYNVTRDLQKVPSLEF